MHHYTHTPGSPDYTSRHHVIRRISKREWQILSSLPTTTHATYGDAKAYASEITYPAPPTKAEVQAKCAAAGLSECETALAVGSAMLSESRGYEAQAVDRDGVQPSSIGAISTEMAQEEAQEWENGLTAASGTTAALGTTAASPGGGMDYRNTSAPPEQDRPASSPVWDRLWTWAGWGRPEHEGPWRGQPGSVNDWWAQGESMVRSLLAVEPEHRLHIGPGRSILAVWRMGPAGLGAQVWLDSAGGLQLLGAWDGDRARWAWAWRAGRMAEEDIDDVALGRVLVAIGGAMGRELEGVALQRAG